MIKDFLNERRYNGEKLVPYLGIDATAPSLHVGHLIPLLFLSQFEHSYVVIGTTTAMVGDPTGKSEQRARLEPEAVKRNAAYIQHQITTLLPNTVLETNASFSVEEISDHISVNKLIRYELFTSRLGAGLNLSLTEFLYPLRQAYDFLHLHRRHGVNLQIGGSDQYTNILTGIDLVRAVEGTHVFGKTTHLLAGRSGKKVSKTDGGAVFLNDDPFKVWQFFRNIKDQDLIVFGRTVPLHVPEINAAKRELATSMTAWVFNAEIAAYCAAKADEMFGRKEDVSKPEQQPTEQQP